MISLYRIIRYSGYTLINFQGDCSDVQALSRILHFPLKRSTNHKLFECGYYAYLRGSWRQKSEQESLRYLSNNYCAPQVRVSVFKGDFKLPDDRSPKDWVGILSNAILKFFGSKGYPSELGGIGYTIYRKTGTKLGKRISGKEGISFRIEMRDYVPYLYLDISYRFLLDGKTVSHKKLALEIETTTEDFENIQRFAKRSTDEIFQVFKDFINSFKLEIDEAVPVLSFADSPLIADLIGMRTLLWCHNYPIYIDFANDKKVTHSSFLFEHEDCHIFRNPSKPMLLTLVYPSTDTNSLNNSSHDLGRVIQCIKDILVQSLGKGLHIPVECISYSPHQGASQCIAHFNKVSDNYPDHTHAIIIASPHNNACAEDFLRDLTFQLRKSRQGAFTHNLSCEDLADPRIRRYVLEQSILKCISMAGGTTWQISNTPLPNNCEIGDLGFIGIDINTNKSIPAVGGVIINAHGIIQGYNLNALPYSDGDSIPEEVFKVLVGHLLGHYKRANGEIPSHLIIHRDGLVGREVAAIPEIENEYGLTIDVVEIRKSGSLRVKQMGNSQGTPSADLCVLSHVAKEAYVMTTKSICERHGNRVVFPAPIPLHIRHVFGETDIELLAAQVYALTLANFNSARRTNRLPVTISYADSLVNNANLKTAQRGFGKAIDKDSILYWL